MAIFSRSKATRDVPSFHVPRVRVPNVNVDGLQLRLAAASAALAQARLKVTRVGAFALSPGWWWAEITSATGVAVLLALSVVSLIAALIVTWPHR